MTKPEVRAIAEAAGLPTAQKPESQEICFVPDGNYARFIERYLEEEKSGEHRAASENDLPVINRADADQSRTENHLPLAPGEIVSTTGEVLGQHSGIHRYTVGQRRGLGVSAAEPLYVVQIDAPRNRVVVGTSDALLKREMIVMRANWIAV